MHASSLLRSVLFLVLGAGLMVGCAGSNATSNGSASSASRAQAAPNGDEDENGIKPFGEVVPDDATTDDGLLTTHRTDDKLFVEIPDSLIGRELLMV